MNSIRLGLTLGDTGLGLKVHEVERGGPCALAGIRKDDFLIQVDEARTVLKTDFERLTKTWVPGQRLRFELKRAGETLKADVMVAGIAGAPTQEEPEKRNKSAVRWGLGLLTVAAAAGAAVYMHKARRG
mmetsp:Transcript_13038/g.14670  ORF Transcript_13038/g.14670 Transcript_13038/m.14670 type:complete len:129 (+) Transcript_13038:49-435(+)|eukprot:CAMPEP_0205830922 /NCGR_PEP_ID=MMETSP0206-20130828/42520_1 /ASSEMBLY_ACC=CAM_ASM_000279 /TAXON_ID=36767 /ORGANISM="Euplotes focardii, Strain TN1" /LENGTH=128 /DNA_ID=CAMNT_0053135033 /DNA_START=47 /DNA_END=433 /DNA_ORIENTATION=-